MATSDFEKGARDPEATALATRLAEKRGVPVTDTLVILARRALDANNGDQEGAYEALQRHQPPDPHPL